MSDNDSSPRFETRAVASADDEDQHPFGDVVSPIHLATTFAQEGVQNADPEYTYLTAAQRREMDITDGLIRMSVGIEHPTTSSRTSNRGCPASELLTPSRHQLTSLFGRV